MGDDKPFECNAPGCGMRFINEDHLTVHCKKHEMSLSLNTESNNVKSNNATLFVDQTPTPTRFIRNCEEVGLFQDLNPFEEQFRKHYEASKMGHMLVPEIPHGTSDNDILNTPSILPDDLQADTCDVLQSCGAREERHRPSVADEVVIYGEEDDDDDGDKHCDVVIAIDLESPEKVESRPRTDGERAEDEMEEEMDVVSRSASGSSVAFSVSTVAKENSKFVPHRNAVMQALLASNCSNSSDASILPAVGSPDRAESMTITSTSSADARVLALPTMSIATHAASDDASALEGTNGMVQLILKLPDGRTVPLHIPASVPTSATPLAPTVSSQVQQQSFVAAQLLNSTNSNSANNSSYAKMKLREALTQGTIGGGRINYAFKLIDEEQVSAYQEMFNLDSTSNDSDFIEKSNTPKRKRGEEDPEEKRRRFLERNRAAATRCRQKRKTWIRSLENKADELAGMNEHLQNEVAMLRNEVAQLKSMLLAHKDCPVTQQQQKHMGNLGGLPPGSTIIVSTCSNGTIQMSADEVIASSALTNLARSSADAVERSAPTGSTKAPKPVLLRAIMTHEQALGLLRRSAQSSLVKSPTTSAEV